jgi:hypothetical protein
VLILSYIKKALSQATFSIYKCYIVKCDITEQENIVSATVRYKCKLRLQMSRTFLCILLIRNRMVSRETWIKQVLVSFSNTSNSIRPSDSCYFDAL